MSANTISCLSHHTAAKSLYVLSLTRTQANVHFIAKWKGLKNIACYIGDEYIHLYLVIPPQHFVSYVIQIFKSKTSGWLKKKTKKFPLGALWARDCLVSTIGINKITVKNTTKTNIIKSH